MRNRRGQGWLKSLCRMSIHKDIIERKEDSELLHNEVVEKFVEKPGGWPFFINDGYGIVLIFALIIHGTSLTK